MGDATLKLADLMAAYKLSRSGDQWGDCMGWLFRIADSLTFHHEVEVPEEWSFRPSPMGRADDPAEDYEAATCDAADPDELVRFGRVLWRLREMLIKAGANY